MGRLWWWISLTDTSLCSSRQMIIPVATASYSIGQVWAQVSNSYACGKSMIDFTVIGGVAPNIS